MQLFVVLLIVMNFALAETMPGVEPGSPGKTVLEKGTIYSPIGKRDPFKPLPLNPSDRGPAGNGGLEKFTLEQFQLRAILRGMGKARAMFEDPEGKTYILSEGDKIGREHSTISRIVNSEVILTQRTFDYLGAESLLEKVLSLAKEPDINTAPVSRGTRQEGTKDASAAGVPTQAAPSPVGNLAGAPAAGGPSGNIGAVSPGEPGDGPITNK